MSDSPDNLDRRIERFYENQTLPAETLADLRDMIRVEAAEPVSSITEHLDLSPIGQIRWLSAALVTLVALCIGLGILLVQQNDRPEQLDVVAAEIALNHVKQFDTEFDTVSIASLAAEMELLDFAPIHPKRMQYENYDLVGARYCTIDRAIAVQVRMVDDDDHAYTLYQFRDEPRLALDETVVIDVENIEVTLWREGDVVMGLAHRVER